MPTVPGNPSLFPPVVYFDSEVIQWPHWHNSDGVPFENPADGMIPKPIVEPLSIGIIHGIKWVGSYSNAEFKNELNATNAGVWRNNYPGQAWISRIIAEEETVNNVLCVKIHYVIRTNEFGWNTNFPWTGYFYRYNGYEVAFTTADKVPYIGFIDNNGGKSNSPVTSDQRIKRRISFGSLGF